MTGYGAAEEKVGKGVLFAEIRSVNNRFLDINCKLPPTMYAIEPRIKKLSQNKLLRGKLEVFLKAKKDLADSLKLSVNTGLVKQYRDCLTSITKMLGLKASSHLLEVVDLKELVVFHEDKLDVESLWKQIERVVRKAIERLDAMRKKEGQALKKDQLKRIVRLKQIFSSIEKRFDVKSDEYRSKVEAAVLETTSSDDIALPDRIDITEELIRLKSHIVQYSSLLRKAGAVGRQIDFLLQEMHREINTLGSKACDGHITTLVVDAKSELEKLREQVQNIE